MKRKLVWIGVPWLLGLYLATACQSSVTVSLLLAALLLLGAFRLYRRITTAQAVCVAVSFCTAIGAVLTYTSLVYQPILSHADTATTFSGKVVSVQIYDQDRASYRVKGAFADGTAAKLLVYTDDLGAVYGDILEVAGTFSVPEDTYLWSGNAYYKAKGIYLQADSDAYVSCTSVEGNSLMRTLQAYRQRISTKLIRYAGTEAGGMASAMLLGTKETVSDETDAVLTHQSIRHVVSLSGFHLVLILSIWLWFCKGIRLEVHIRFLGSVLLVFLYAMMAEFPVSILRAGCMVLLVHLAPLCYRAADTPSALCAAGIVLTIANPFLIQDASFLLSMAGTCGLGVLAPWMTKRLSGKSFGFRLVRQFLSMVCVSVCVFPVSLLYFREVSVISPLSNLLFIPACTLMMVLSLVVFLTGGTAVVVKPACFCIRLLFDGIMGLAYKLEDWMPLRFPTGWRMLPLLVAVLIGFVLVELVLRKKQKAVAMAIAVSMAILLLGQQVYQMRERSYFLVTILGEKKQMVVVISYQGKQDVIDITGNHRNPEMVQAYAAEQGIRRLNALCLTKHAQQMRVAYPQTLELEADQVIVPTNCVLASGTTISGAVPQQMDEFVLIDPTYRITWQDSYLTVSYGTMAFCIGTGLSEIPEGNWNAVICTTWTGGDVSDLPAQLYLKETPIQLRIAPSGTWTLTELIDSQ